MSARRELDASAAESAVVIACVLLAGLGAVMIYSATAPLAPDALLPPHFLRHLTGIALGAGIAVLAARLPLRGGHALALPLWALAVILLVVTLFFGQEANGARRWLPLFGQAVQPGEFAKLATLLAVAAVAARRDGRAPLGGRRLAAALGLAALPAGLLLLQPDLGSAALLLGLAFLIVFVAGARLRLLVLPALAGLVGVGLYVAMRPYAYRRWIGFLDPWETALSQGFQLVQSFVAFGRGGVTGVGFGYGRQKLHYLPEAHTDFILSVIAEELGVLGVLVVLAAFATLTVAGLRIALGARQRFAALLASGVTLLLTLPAALNAAVVMGAFPTKGLTLPFVSYGRSSFLICCAAAGLLVGVARQTGRSERDPVVGRRREASA